MNVLEDLEIKMNVLEDLEIRVRRANNSKDSIFNNPLYKAETAERIQIEQLKLLERIAVALEKCYSSGE